MKILIIHNIYSTPGGEESVVEMQRSLFESLGHEVFTYFRSYNEIKSWKLGRLKSLFTSLANYKAADDVEHIIKSKGIEVVFIHNLFPIISPIILPRISQLGVKSVMILHNYRLLCPTGLFLRDGKPCERCTKGLREINCLIGRCEGSVAGSLGYALRAFNARIFSLFRGNIDIFAATTSFQREKLVKNGFGACRIEIIPNFTTFESVAADFSPKRDGSVLYVGRLSHEKGFDLVFEAAKLLPDVQFNMAGAYNQDVIEKFDIPTNVVLLGQLGKDQLTSLYQNSSLLIFPTRCYESFPLSLLEAGVNMLPVVGSRIGATASILEDEVSGVLFESDNSKDIAKKIEKVLKNSELAHKIAQNNYINCKTTYSKERYASCLEKFMTE